MATIRKTVTLKGPSHVDVPAQDKDVVLVGVTHEGCQRIHASLEEGETWKAGTPLQFSLAPDLEGATTREVTLELEVADTSAKAPRARKAKVKSKAKAKSRSRRTS